MASTSALPGARNCGAMRRSYCQSREFASATAYAAASIPMKSPDRFRGAETTNVPAADVTNSRHYLPALNRSFRARSRVRLPHRRRGNDVTLPREALWDAPWPHHAAWAAPFRL